MTRISIFIKLVVFTFQSASQRPPPSFLLLLPRLSSSSSSIPPPHIFPGAAASLSSVRRSAAMEDSPGAMNKVSSVPEIKPLDQYDFNRAKLRASVRWLLSKSYGSAGKPVHITEALLGWGA